MYGSRQDTLIDDNQDEEGQSLDIEGVSREFLDDFCGIGEQQQEQREADKVQSRRMDIELEPGPSRRSGPAQSGTGGAVSSLLALRQEDQEPEVEMHDATDGALNDKFHKPNFSPGQVQLVDSTANDHRQSQESKDNVHDGGGTRGTSSTRSNSTRTNPGE
jgi:hypothetical protein